MFEEEFDRTSDKSDRRNKRNKKFDRNYDKPDKIHLVKVFTPQRERKQTKQLLNELY